MGFTHPELVQGLLDLYKSPRYLEVGVDNGATFRSIAAERKVAVDPCFRFDVRQARLDESHSLFHEVASDDYFGGIAQPGDEFDVIFLDGLHTFEQTLRDFNNAALLLAEHGVIMLDDVQPTSNLAAVSDRESFEALRRIQQVESGAWMGDVYRLVFFLDSFWQQFAYRTIAETNSQLIAWRQPRQRVSVRTVEEVARMSYDDMLLAREHFHTVPYSAVLEDIRTTNGFQTTASPH